MTFQTRTFFIAILILSGFSFKACANPQGEQVVSGSASFDRSAANTLTVNTSSNNTIINYGSFSIAASEATRFNQPSSSSAVLNRVIGADPSAIYGSLSSNGKLFLVNPNGIIFGAASKVDAPAILASTLDISNNDFLNGNYIFSKNGKDSYIINQGRLAASPGGYVALLSQAVDNQGVIVAPLGSVALAAGDKMTLGLDSQSQISVAVDDGVKAELTNSGTISANGGRAILTAKVLNDVFNTAINNSGLIEANSIQDHDGVVEFLSNAGIDNSGAINASVLNENGYTFNSTGSLNVGHGYYDNLDGAINISGNISGVQSDVSNINFTGDVTLTGDTTLQADSDNNQSGKIIMNSHSLTGGDFNLVLTTGENDTLDGSITGVNLLTLNSSTSNNKTFTSTGTNFTVNSLKTNNYSLFSRSQGSGTSGDPYMIYSDSNVQGGLEYIPTLNLSAHYKMANNIDAAETSSWNSGTGFTPVGNGGTPFTGNFDGSNYVVSNLFIDLPSTDTIGMFGQTGAATISNIGLTNVNITGQDYVGGLLGYSGGATATSVANSYVTGAVAGRNDVGGLVGANDKSTISGSYAKASVTGSNGNIGGLAGESISSSSISDSYATGIVTTSGGSVGGLVGYNHDHSTISHGYATGSVSGAGSVGGLVGYNDNYAGISDSYATGTATDSGNDVGGLVGNNLSNASITNSYATGIVSGSGSEVGGLVGINSGSSTISDSYAVGSVTQTGASYAGGLVGWNISSSISDSYATGAVTGTYNVGGLVGQNFTSTVSNSFATGAVSASNSYAGGLEGFDYFSTISDSYATGAVSQSGGSYAGGLVGHSTSSNISNAYATGSVTGINNIGGLVGDNYSSSSITNSYATGTVSASGSYAGGLIGYDDGSNTLTNNWWYNSQTYGIGNNGTAQSTGHWQLASAISDFYGTGTGVGNLYSTWTFGSGGWKSFSSAYPHLDWEWASTITTLLQLQNINLDLGGSYTLGNDLDAIGTAGWNAGAGFVPIGTSGAPFTGTFDGNSYTISNLFIDRPSTDNVGLFGYTLGAGISNVELPNVNITGQNNVGGLVGYNHNSSGTSHSYTTGSVTGSGASVSYAGGLVGWNINSPISDSYSTATVSGFYNVGGLVGQNFSSTISNSYATGTVTASSDYVGGLVGLNYDSTITNSYATGVVTGGSNYVGGLAGNNSTNSTISDSYATGAVVNSGNNYAGGLVGWNYNSSSITDSYATGTVTGVYNVWGLVGQSFTSTISNSFATGAVSASNSYAGGLTGFDYFSTVSNSYATGAVTQTGGSYAGGLVGHSTSSNISNSYSTGSVTGINNVGGLIGDNYSSSSIANSYTTGTVSASGSYAGGLIGYDDGSNTLTNDWWFNSQTYGIGNNGTAQSTGHWQLASGISDFYNSSFSVYTGSTPWDFSTVWYAPSGAYPLLR